MVAGGGKEVVAGGGARRRGRQAGWVPDGWAEYGPFNVGSRQGRIEAEVTERLQQVVEPMQAEYEQQQAQDNDRTVLQQHPDFENDMGLRSVVQHLLEENDSLDLETAYWAARGKRAKQQQAEQQESRRAKRRAAKEAALKATGTPRRAGVQGRPARGDLKRASAADILAIAQAMHRK